MRLGAWRIGFDDGYTVDGCSVIVSGGLSDLEAAIRVARATMPSSANLISAEYLPKAFVTETLSTKDEP